MEREPTDIALLQFLADEGFSAIVVSAVLALQVDEEEQVLPLVVLSQDVLFETI